MDKKCFDKLIENFIKESRYSTYYSSLDNILIGDKKYSLIRQPGYYEPGFLQENIKYSVMSYTRNKDTIIQVYKNLVSFLSKNGVEVEVQFPPISISSSFERQMFIAKYLQDERARVSDLSDLLWVNQRTIEEDLRKLRGDDDDPIQICGKPFYISEMERSNNRIHFASTAHPLFLTENLTQVVIMLKGLRKMSRQSIVKEYAMATAANIWSQLSPYAKKRIDFVLSEIMPEDKEWYEQLETYEIKCFVTERDCNGISALLECMKSEKPFWVEYESEDGRVIYPKCKYIKKSYNPEYLLATCEGEEIKIEFSRVIKSCDCEEQLYLI